MTKTHKTGFTIIELLIVIVVIGILAAIVTVTYQGVQNKANTTASEQNAREVLNKAQAFNAVATTYPTIDELKAARVGATSLAPGTGTEVVEAKLSEKVKNLLSTSDPSSGSGTDKARIGYKRCDNGTTLGVGVKVTYWDFSANSVKEMIAGERGDSC